MHQWLAALMKDKELGTLLVFVVEDDPTWPQRRWPGPQTYGEIGKVD